MPENNRPEASSPRPHPEREEQAGFDNGFNFTNDLNKDTVVGQTGFSAIQWEQFLHSDEIEEGALDDISIDEGWAKLGEYNSNQLDDEWFEEARKEILGDD